MISNKDFKRLCEIDEKMLNNESMTIEEFKERTKIIKNFNDEVDRAYVKHEGIM